MTQNENDANDYTQDINDNFAAAKAAIAEVASNSAPSSLVQTVNTLSNTVNNLNIPDAQIQADWAQTDNTKKDYIKNKPVIPDTSNMQTTNNLVTSVSGSSTNSQYPSAKLFYDTIGNIEAALAAINGE